MPSTEIAIPTLKTDSESIEKFKKSWPAISQTFATHPDIKSGAYGWIAEENGKDVKNDSKFLLLLEWHEHSGYQAFQNFLTSSAFKTFISEIIGFVAAPEQPQFFETHFSPVRSATAPLTEIIRTRVKTPRDIESAEQAWKKLTTVVGDCAKGTTHGRSLNLDEELYLGVLGWESFEARKAAEGIQEGLQKLDGIGETSVVVVPLEPLERTSV